MNANRGSFDASQITHPAPSIVAGVAVQDLAEEAPSRNTYLIVRFRHGREITGDDNPVVRLAPLSQEAEDAAVGVVAVNPLESARSAILPVQGRLAGVSAVERFNPGLNRWTAGAPLPRPRVAHSTTVLPGGQVLVVGGHVSAAEPSFLNTADIYDSTTDRWRPAADLPP